jgi:hypothetical protein
MRIYLDDPGNHIGIFVIYIHVACSIDSLQEWVRAIAMRSTDRRAPRTASSSVSSAREEGCGGQADQDDESLRGHFTTIILVSSHNEPAPSLPASSASLSDPRPPLSRTLNGSKPASLISSLPVSEAFVRICWSYRSVSSRLVLGAIDDCIFVVCFA